MHEDAHQRSLPVPIDRPAAHLTADTARAHARDHRKQGPRQARKVARARRRPLIEIELQERAGRLLDPLRCGRVAGAPVGDPQALLEQRSEHAWRSIPMSPGQRRPPTHPTRQRFGRLEGHIAVATHIHEHHVAIAPSPMHMQRQRVWRRTLLFHAAVHPPSRGRCGHAPRAPLSRLCAGLTPPLRRGQRHLWRVRAQMAHPIHRGTTVQAAAAPGCCACQSAA